MDLLTISQLTLMAYLAWLLWDTRKQFKSSPKPWTEVTVEIEAAEALEKPIQIGQDSSTLVMLLGANWQQVNEANSLRINSAAVSLLQSNGITEAVLNKPVVSWAKNTTFTVKFQITKEKLQEAKIAIEKAGFVIIKWQ